MSDAFFDNRLIAAADKHAAAMAGMTDTEVETYVKRVVDTTDFVIGLIPCPDILSGFCWRSIKGGPPWEPTWRDRRSRTAIHCATYERATELAETYGDSRPPPRGPQGRAVRALLIDPEKRTVTEITTPGDWDTIRDLLHTYYIAIAAPAFVRYPDGGTDVVYFDDYQDEVGDNPKWWHQIDADLDSRLSPPRARRALVIGVDHGKPYPAGLGVSFYKDLVGPDYRGGEHCDARISVEELTARVTFTRRVFRDYKEDEDGFISIVAPIVEER